MEKLSACKKYIRFIIPLVWLIAVTGLILCLLYSERHWNDDHFRTFYARWEFSTAYLIEAITLTVFFITFLVSSKKSEGILRKAVSVTSFILLCAGTLAVVITLIANTIGLGKVIKDYKLDCQLESDNQELFYEAVDALIPYASSPTYYFVEPNTNVLKAARQGYPRAQNAMGCYYHHKAKRKSQSDADFDHAIYWFIKAAQNDYAPAQTNLGRILMGDLESNRQPDTELAKQWFIMACNDDYVEAFYYLGKIYSEENKRLAYDYWSKGAELGSEECARQLETPEFALGLYDDDALKDKNIEPTDTIDL